MDLAENRDRNWNLYLLLYRTREAVRAIRSQELKKCGLTTQMAAVLHNALSLGQKATVAELARRMFRASHTITGLLNRMENHGLIKRVKDTNKKNRVIVVLTCKGLEAYAKSVTARTRIHNMISALSEKDRHALHNGLAALWVKALDELDIQLYDVVDSYDTGIEI